MELADRLSEALGDRYRIEREIGSGGMATVFLAHDLKHDRAVALKVLRDEVAQSVGAERFLQEIRIVAQLQHPHVLTLLDSGEVGGTLYYVMPYIEGESLRDKLEREHELPVPDALRLLREVADALAFAHGKGVVHRDIKPDNVLLTGRHAVVADFGVSKALTAATGENKVTTLGVALGTPAYMAPEQAAADATIDHRADIYALGILGYELLTGRPPFTGSTPQQILGAQVTVGADAVSGEAAGGPVADRRGAPRPARGAADPQRGDRADDGPAGKKASSLPVGLGRGRRCRFGGGLRGKPRRASTRGRGPREARGDPTGEPHR
jgi:serine/threonine-protein kinase